MTTATTRALDALDEAATINPHGWDAYKDETECVACDAPSGCPYTVSECGGSGADICFVFADETGAKAKLIALSVNLAPSMSQVVRAAAKWRDNVDSQGPECDVAMLQGLRAALDAFEAKAKEST